MGELGICLMLFAVMLQLMVIGFQLVRIANILDRLASLPRTGGG